jgi:hypothetical protein
VNGMTINDSVVLQFGDPWLTTVTCYHLPKLTFGGWMGDH